MKIELSDYEAKVTRDALVSFSENCLESGWCDSMAAERVAQRIEEAAEKCGVDLDNLDEDDE